MPSERAMDLVQHAYDADAAARERRRLRNKKQALAGVYASAGAEVVAADGDDSDGGEDARGDPRRLEIGVFPESRGGAAGAGRVTFSIAGSG